MIRETLQEYIDVYNTNYSMKGEAIRGMEQLGEWKVASEYWKKLGYKEDAEACRTIQNANEIGDQYRAEIKPLNDWVDYTVENNLMPKEDALKSVYNVMEHIHDKYYPKG